VLVSPRCARIPLTPREFAHRAPRAQQYAIQHAHLILGKVTRKKVCKPEAPSEIAASSSCVPCSMHQRYQRPGHERKVTKVVASAMPAPRTTPGCRAPASRARKKSWRAEQQHEDEA